MFVPLQHIHPMLVHFPIVLLYLAVAFDIGATFMGRSVTDRSTAGRISLALVVLAALSAIATYTFGSMALNVAEASGFHSDVAETHEMLGQWTAISFTIWAALRAIAWWRDTRLAGALSAMVPVIGLLGVVLVTSTAYYGGELVYALGVNVTRLTSGG
jgi:uncharacterized membrane protein